MKPDIIICLGRMLLENNKPCAVLRSRLNKMIELLIKYPNVKAILSGGKYHASNDENISEAKGMYDYVKLVAPELIKRCTIEDKSGSTISQLCILKTDYIEKRGYKRIGLVTDEAHMPRAALIFHSILGPEYEIINFPSPLDVSGVWGKLIKDKEQELYELTIETRTSLIKPGDHEKWMEYERRFMEEKKRKMASKEIDITNTPKVS